MAGASLLACFLYASSGSSYRAGMVNGLGSMGFGEGTWVARVAWWVLDRVRGFCLGWVYVSDCCGWRSHGVWSGRNCTGSISLDWMQYTGRKELPREGVEWLLDLCLGNAVAWSACRDGRAVMNVHTNFSTCALMAVFVISIFVRNASIVDVRYNRCFWPISCHFRLDPRALSIWAEQNSTSPPHNGQLSSYPYTVRLNNSSYHSQCPSTQPIPRTSQKEKKQNTKKGKKKKNSPPDPPQT